MMLLDIMHINYDNAARLMSSSPNHFNCLNQIMGAHTYDDAISNLPAERAGEECRKRYLAWAEDAAAVGAHGCVWAIDGRMRSINPYSQTACSMAARIGLVSYFHTILSTPATVAAQPHCMCFTDDQWLHQNVGKWFVQLIPSASCAHSGFALCAFFLMPLIRIGPKVSAARWQNCVPIRHANICAPLSVIRNASRYIENRCNYIFVAENYSAKLENDQRCTQMAERASWIWCILTRLIDHTEIKWLLSPSEPVWSRISI